MTVQHDETRIEIQIEEPIFNTNEKKPCGRPEQ